MRIELPIEIITKSHTFTVCEVKKTSAIKLSDAFECMENKGVIYAMIEFMKGSIIYFETEDGERIDDIKRFESICRNTPVMTAEVIVLKAMSLIHPNEYVQGFYVCPMCKKQIKVNEENGNSIAYNDIEIEKVPNKPWDYEISESVTLTDVKTGVIKHSAKHFTFHYPTLNNCITGIMRYPNDKGMKQNLAMLVDCIDMIDGQPVDKNWLKIWGIQLFGKIPYDEMQEISDQASRGGLQKYIDVYCPNCGETFSEEIDTSSFFLSGIKKRK